MSIQSILIFLAIGLVAGYLASFIVGGGGLIRYLLTGVVGAFVGGFLFSYLGVNLGIGNPLLVTVIHATVGAIVVVLIARVLA
jgi:uncharacterized membrane protein YeaQ/YmgE (transglycosylase-associated protein family)